MKRRLYIERKYAKQVTDLLSNNPRCNLFASPGMGKTVMSLTALDMISMTETDVWPVLVVGPLRVVNTVWAREVEEWAHLDGLKVSVIVGTPAQREAAVKQHADIYCINYENLLWLHLLLEHTKWPFKTVIPDESTRLKNLRCHWSAGNKKTGRKALIVGEAGSLRAAALAKNAVKYPRHINMSGTPAPKGLQDLWGQNWFVDFGKGLGNSFNAFKNRWFIYPKGENGYKAPLVPMEHAHEAITEAIKPHTLTLDAYDWFPIKRPREIDVFVELPEKVRKHYNTMLRKYYLQITKDKDITAVNAAVKTMKLLQIASGTVLDEDKVPHNLHGEKLEALESIVENTQGKPLLVVYHFKADAARIKKKFTNAVLLSSNSKRQKVQEDQWNAGKIDMLLVHPQSAGHGLSLQHGGYQIVFYTPWWNSEYYDQVIERIGPTRQYQSGYDRYVEVYRILARRTVDQTVLQVLKDRGEVQDAIKQATKWLT